MLASPKALWDNSLLLIKDSVTEQQYNTWFKPIVFESYKPSTKTLLVQVPSPFVYEYLEQNFVDLLSKVLHRNFGEGIRLTYRVVTDKEHKLSQDIEADPDDADMAKQTRECAQQINFYQSIDMLIVDDIQEWAGKAKTLNTFFHIFNHLFRNGKRIILACDRPPVELKDMPDRLLTRFSCGLVCELEKPNIQLCVDILSNKIRRDGLKIPVDVISFIAQTCNGSVRDLQGAINGLLAYSIVYNSSIDIRLAERVIKRAVKVDDKPLTIDDIVETVCHHYNVTVTAVNSKSRKRDYVVARQVTMYLAQKYTKMPASRIGKLVGNRDHSTVIHSCSKVEERLKIDAGFSDELVSIENGLKVKRA